jgi:hypothetical protein
MADPATVSKGDFARLKNVSAGRVSQWIAEGKLGPDALEGEGRYAKIRVEIANAQLRANLDIGQQLGNGLGTDLGDEPDEDPALPLGAAAKPVPLRNPYDEGIRRERLEDLQRRNRQAAREELAEQGIYTPTVEAQAAMAGLAASILQAFEVGLADQAAGIAARFNLPERDVLHQLQADFRAIRAAAADAARRKAAVLDPIVLDDPKTADAQAA